jgi:hypothetical protein
MKTLTTMHDKADARLVERHTGTGSAGGRLPLAVGRLRWSLLERLKEASEGGKQA